MVLLRRLLPHIGIALAVLGCLWLAYRHGVAVTTDEYEAQIATERARYAEAQTRAVETAREQERAAAQYVAGIDQTLTENLRNELQTRDRTIAALRDDTLRLRDRFTCPAPDMPGPTPGTGGSDATSEGGLRREDAELLISIASEADRVVRQLQACQALLIQ